MLFHVFVSLLYFFYQFSPILVLFLRFLVLFGWLSAMYVVFPVCNISIHL